jgi:hypothetical protein
MILKNKVLVILGFVVSTLFSGVSVSEDMTFEMPEEVRSTAQNNIEYLMNQTIAKAKLKLKEGGGELYPFGAALFGGGKIRYVWVGGEKGSDNLPPPQAALHGVRRTLQANAIKKAIVGSAVYYVLAEQKEDGSMENKLIVELEHLPSIAIARGIKFSIGKDGEILYGASGEREFESKVFVVDDVFAEEDKEIKE